MFGKLNKKHIKRIIWVLTILIVPSFILWGANFALQDRSNEYAGEMFGKKISVKKFLKSKLAVEHIFILKGIPQKPNPFTINKLAWDRLILLQEAKKIRIKINDKKVIKTIASMPFFKKDGYFDKYLYQQILEITFNISKRQFEEEIRDALTIEKLYAKNNSNISITENELIARYKKEHEKISLNYIYVDCDDFKIEKPSSNEIKAYYEKNIKDFQNKVMIDTAYLGTFYKKKITKSEKENIKSKIDALVINIDEYTQLEQFAKTNSLDFKTTGERIADNKLLSDKDPESQIIAISTFLPVGKISSPMEISNGYFMLKVLEKKDGYTIDFNKAKGIIIDKITNEQKTKLALNEINLFYDQMIKKQKQESKKNFKQLAKSLKKKPFTTSTFTRQTKIFPKLGYSKELANIAFVLKENEISPPLRIENKFYLFRINKLDPLDMEKFNKDKKNFLQTELTKEENNSNLKLLSQLRKKANLQSNISALTN
ncbi:MAG: peptidylprolyl isomerase [Candidatus Gygaella obscura]|nr:peptidylprolyl isomerase [Candidatus Gygaella obscura]